MRETARLAALKAGRYAMPYREAYESAVMEKSAMADRLILGSVYGTPAAVQAGRWSSLSTLSLAVMQGLSDGRGGEDEEQQRKAMRPRLRLSRRDDERQGPTHRRRAHP
ncbi:MAG: hypothetical protein LBG81_09090 [Coriobacteriaceae bacterium]|jgi:hypothetical protein|nr:hypothetical protein [Coriobacteriaceae bacterium]